MDNTTSSITGFITNELSEAAEKGKLEPALERYMALFRDAAERLRNSDRPLTAEQSRQLNEVSHYRIP